MNRDSFTLLEIVFVTVVICVIASVAISKASYDLNSAAVSKIRSEISLIRSAIMQERERNLLKNGADGFIQRLDEAQAGKEDEILFNGTGSRKLVQTEIFSTDPDKKEIGRWIKISNSKYEVVLSSDMTIAFSYDDQSGRFECDESKQLCKEVNY